jgi:hypothetical protein
MATVSKMASTEIARGNEEAVALALRELSLSRGDQEGLADFLTDYFGSINQRKQGLSLIWYFSAS